MGKNKVLLWDHEKFAERAEKQKFKYSQLSYEGSYTKPYRDLFGKEHIKKSSIVFPSGTKVITPKGRGRVVEVEDDIVFVEFNDDPIRLFEFEQKEICFAKKKKRKKK